MTAPQLEPHSRWRLRDRLDRLAKSYDAAASAIDAFTRAAQGYDPCTPRTRTAARLWATTRRQTTRRAWSRILWFTATLLLAGFLLAWISLDIMREFIPGPVPTALAAAPGLLLTLALGGTAILGSAPVPAERRSWRNTQHSREVRVGPALDPVRSWPFAITLTGCAAWITTWLAGVAAIPVWFALTTGILSSAVTGAAFLAAGRATTPRADTELDHEPRLPAPSRRLLARQQTAQRRLREHAGLWSSAAHACGLTASGSAEAAVALNRLLTTGELGDLPGEGLDAFHTQMLVTLYRQQPGPLNAQLGAASARLLPQRYQLLPATDRNFR
jgi:hypothetical protein